MKAETLVKKHWNLNYDEEHNPCYYENECILMMQEFAKYHVQKALEAVSENNTIDFIDLQDGEKFEYFDVLVDSNIQAVVSKESILNSYPLENIK